MKLMRLLPAVIALAAAAATACGSVGQPGTIATTPSASPAAAQASAPSATAPSDFLPPGCAQALAALPASVPATEKDAGSDAGPLIGHKGTVAASMEGTVAADTFNIGLDFAGGNPVAADVAKWKSDVAALRSYCKGS